MEDSPKLGELRNGAKTKAGPLEAEQLSRLGTCYSVYNLSTYDADLLKMRGFEPFLATSPFSHTVYWFLSAHLGAGNFRLNSLMSVEHI